MFDYPAPKRKKSGFTVGAFDPNFGKKKQKSRDVRRAFTKTQKNEIWEQQGGKCAKCKKPLDLRTVEYDHKKGWADKGRTVVVNGQALCPHCHKLKTHAQRLKKVDKKRTGSRANSNLGAAIFGEGSRSKKSNNPFNWGI